MFLQTYFIAFYITYLNTFLKRGFIYETKIQNQCIGLAINLSDFRQLTLFGVFWCQLTFVNGKKMRRLMFFKRFFSFIFIFFRLRFR